MPNSFRILIGLLLAVFAIGVVVIVLVVSVNAARAHDFFDRWCCSGQDCQPAPLGSVSWTPDGWSVTTPNLQDVVPLDDQRIRYTPKDQPQFFICEYPKHRLRCLYVPEPQG